MSHLDPAAICGPEGPLPSLPKGFRACDDGLWFDPPPTDRCPEPPPVFVAAPFEVVGEVRDGSGGGWGLLLSWRDRDGGRHQWSVPKRLVHEHGNTIAAGLEDAGLTCGVGSRAQGLLKQFINGVRAPRRLFSAGRAGWHEADGQHAFMLPTGEAFGPAAAKLVLQSDGAVPDAAYQAAGTLADWQREVAAYAVGNDRLGLFVSSAFAGPLLDVMAEPSGGVHLTGVAQSGKSTATFAAGSVWGRGDRGAQVRPWRGTANGIEGVAAETSDTVLILDEISQADAREVGDVVYMLANEGGKARAGRGGQARQRQTWRSLFLSTGELTLAAKMAEEGKRTMAGLEVRLVNLPADAGAGLGVFQALHDKPGPAVLADHLRDMARVHYGTAARAYLERLAHDRTRDLGKLRGFLSGLRDEFLARHVPAGAAGQGRPRRRPRCAPEGRGQLLRRPRQRAGEQRPPLPRGEGPVAADRKRLSERDFGRVAHACPARPGRALLGLLRRRAAAHRDRPDLHRPRKGRAVDQGGQRDAFRPAQDQAVALRPISNPGPRGTVAAEGARQFQPLY